FGFDLGFNYRLRDLHPDLANQLTIKNATVGFSRAGDEQGQAAHVHGFDKLYYDPGDPKLFWALVYDAPESEVFNVLNSLRDSFTSLGFIIIVFGGIAASIAARRFTRPIVAIARAAGRVAD